MSAALQDPQQPAQAKVEEAQAELRILSGRHAGASVPLQASLRLGQGDDCDIILSDLALPQGSAWLQAGDGRWRVTAANPAAADATNDPVMATDMADGMTDDMAGDELLAPLAWGQVGQLGGIALTVSAPHAPWQRSTPGKPPTGIKPAGKTAQPATTAKTAQPATPSLPEQPAVPAAAPTSPQTTQAAPAQPPSQSPAHLSPRLSARPAVLTIAAALLLAAGVLLTLWANPGAVPPPASASPNPAPDPAQQQRQVNDIRLALAGYGRFERVFPLP